MEEQPKRVRSCNLAERLAAALLIPVELSRRLRSVGWKVLSFFRTWDWLTGWD